MNNNILLEGLFVFGGIWSIIGAIMYAIMMDKVKLNPQKIVLFVVSGPLMWISLPLSLAVGKVTVKIFDPFYIWLTKK